MNSTDQTQQRQQDPLADVPLALPVAPARLNSALSDSLLTTLLSPLAAFMPLRYARRVRRHVVLVPVLQVGILLLIVLPDMLGEAGNALSRYPTMALVVLSQLLIYGLLWLLAGYLTRPLASRWEDPPSGSFWRAAALWLSFALPVVFAFGMVDWLAEEMCFRPMREAMEQVNVPSITNRYGYDYYYALTAVRRTLELTLIPLVAAQMLRGLALTAGGPLPPLEPLCRDCGYQLEGVCEMYQAHKAAGGNPSGPPVCSECGLQLAASLEPDARPGTAWTRGEDLSLASWARTAGQVLRRPGRFFASLRLHASRQAAVRFWLLNTIAAFVLMVALLAADYLVCRQTHVTGPVLPSFRADPDEPASLSWLIRLLDTVQFLLGFAIGGLSLATLLGCLGAAQVGRLMSRHRGRNMHPAGLLPAAYLSGHMYLALLLFPIVFLPMRIIMTVVLADMPVWFRRVFHDPELVAALAGVLGLVIGLIGYHSAGKAAIRGLQYANR